MRMLAILGNIVRNESESEDAQEHRHVLYGMIFCTPHTCKACWSIKLQHLVIPPIVPSLSVAQCGNQRATGTFVEKRA